MNRENIEVPPSDEQDAFFQWVLSFAEGQPETELITPEGESL